jgi:altronate dehydratase large subunit|tara:strand:- start:9606 stop:10778 length:1173 start_codon:yes stop_codon:yes gene_type:complete
VSSASNSLKGFARSDGRWGLRNHVLILPLHSALCATARKIADESNGAVAVSHDWSGEADADFERIIKTISGFAANPNNFATIFITIGTPNELMIIELAKKLGLNKYEVLNVAQLGSMGKIADVGLTLANSLVKEAAAVDRVSAPWSAIALGQECGGSDALSGITANPALGVASDRLVELGSASVLGETTEILGAEHLLAARAITPEIGAQIVEAVARYERSINYEGIDMRGAQPSRGNIEGGLTTLEEKSLGAAKKAGSAQFSGVLDYADQVPKSGLYFMDTPGHDIEQLTGFAAAGINIVVFTTGRGTPTGSAIVPTIKVATNTTMALAIPDLIDLNAGTIADGLKTLDEVGGELFDLILEVANGKETRAEAGLHHEFSLSRMYNTVIR